MGKGAITIGIIFVLAGLWWAYQVLTSTEVPNWLLIHLSILIAVGIGLIVLNKAEEKIEERKDLKPKKSKK